MTFNLTDEIPPHQKKRKPQRQRKYGIEYRDTKSIFRFLREWRMRPWYDSEKSRDEAYDRLTKRRAPFDRREFRKINR